MSDLPKHPRTGIPILREVFADPGRHDIYYREKMPDSVARYVLADSLADTRDALIKEQAAEITRLRAALAEKIVVKVKPLEFNQRASSWWAMSPFGFYVVAPTKTDNGDQWGIWYPETDIEDDPDGYASNEGAAMAVSQHAYERRVLSAVEAVPASQIRAEALREALAAAIRVIKYGKQSRRDSIVFDVEEAILALIDAPKVTT